MWQRFRCWSFTGVLFIFSVTAGTFPLAGSALAQAPQLVFNSGSNGVFRLSMPGLEAGNANLEGSLDLQEWFTLQSATAQNGEARFAFTNYESASAWFFRGRVGPVPVPIRIVAQTNTNLTAGFLLTAEAGGGVTLRDHQGITYEFTASSNLVSEPVAIQMTVITNFTEFPEHDGSRAAVLFTPEGFAFGGEAQLRITFPENLPAAEMLGYSFEGDGSGFHLIESDPGSNEIILGISRFSGKGVARFSEGRVPTFDSAYDSAKSAIKAAEHRAALRNHQALRELYIAETITEAQYQERLKRSRLRKLDDIYRNAVRPFEQAAATDCAIGQAVVMAELERLGRLWSAEEGKTFRESPYYPKLVEIAPKVRCACARRLIARCETEPGVSGSTLLHGLESILLTSRIYSGRTDAQGCDLGSDEEIRDRLLGGPCFGAWEGTITMTEINTRKGTGTTRMAETWTRTETYDNETTEIFHGSIAAITEHENFIGNDGKRHEYWTMKLSGAYSVGFRRHEVMVDDAFDDVVVTATESAQAAGSPIGSGDTTLRIVDGKFDGLGPGGGAPSLPFTSSIETTFRCKTQRPPNNPCPPSTTSRTKSSLGLFQGLSLGPADPNLIVTVTPLDLQLSWKQIRETQQSSGPPEVKEQRIEVNLRRAPQR